MLRAKYIRNAPDGNGTLFRGDIYQVPMNGLLGGDTGQRIWETNLVAQYSPGTRLVTEDGRVFRYAKAKNIVVVRHFGLKFWNQIADGIAANAGGSSSVGDYTVTLTKDGVTKNEYMGGYLIIHSTINQFRAILSNTATSGGTFVVTLAEPLTGAVTGSTYCEALQCPYANLMQTAGPARGGQNEWSSVAGVPYTITAAVNTYLWIQTWGPMWINPQGVSLQDAGVLVNERQLVFDYEGSVIVVGDASSSSVSMQHAGFMIDRNYESTAGPPLVMLQISP